jgi:flagellar hook-associated protein 1
MSINLALSIAMKSLSTYSKAIAVTSHNIANMDNSYYSKQLADITATTPLDVTGGQVGTGSTVSYIERIRNIFLDTEIQAEESNVGKYTALNSTYELLSAVMTEVNGATDGLQSKIDTFFSDWSALSTAAASGTQSDIDSARATLLSDSEALTETFNTMANDLESIQKSLTTELKTKIDGANSYIQQIYELNKEIKTAYAMGETPNDLLDQRNEALTKLSELVNITVKTKSDGTDVVSIGSYTIVNGAQGCNKLTTVAGKSNPSLEGIGIYQNGANPIDITSSVTGGELAGIIQSRDTVVKGYLDQLNDLAGSLISTVNKIHQAGSNVLTGAQNAITFFTGSNADSIMVNQDIQKDCNKINFKLYTNNDLADIMANLGNKVLNTFVAGGPTTAVNSTTTLASLGIGSGSLNINNITVAFKGTDTIEDLVNNINNNVGSISIVFNESTGKFFMVGSDQFTIKETDTSGQSLLQKLGWTEETDSAALINRSASPTINAVNIGLAFDNGTSTTQKYKFNTAADTLGYASGILTVSYTNGTTKYTGNVNWNTLSTPTSVTLGIQAAGAGYLTTNFNVSTQKIEIKYNVYVASANTYELFPFTLSDQQGNMTQVMNLPGVERFDDVYTTMVGQLSAQVSSGESLLSGYEAALSQYQTMQSDITTVDENTELAQAKLYQRAYDASVRLLSVIDEMLNMLINRTATPSDTTTTTG